MKKLISYLLLFFIVPFSFAQDNILYNADFEILEGSLPQGWAAHTYTDNPEAVKFSMGHEDAYSGRNYIIIENLQPEDAKLMQTVEVEPDTTYKISCYAKVFYMGEGGAGANLSLLDIQGRSVDLKDTGGRWVQLELYGRTGPEQRSLTVTLRVGGYGLMNTGKAFFDDVIMHKVAHVPEGMSVINFFPEPKAAEQQPREQKQKRTQSIPVTVLIALLFLAAAFYLYQHVVKRKHEPLAKRQELKAEVLFFFTLLAGFILRIWLALTMEGYPSDISCFKAWAGIAFSKGLPDFYLQDMFVDYPPGYIYILSIIGFIQKIFGLAHNSPLFLLFIKLPSISTDLFIALLIYKFSKKRFHIRIACTLALLFVFNPAIIHNSAVYGQIDSFFVFFIVLCIYLVYHKRIELGAVVYIAAVLIKPQALILAPVGIYALIRLAKEWEWKDHQRIGVSVACAVISFIVLIIPFSVKQHPLWIFHLYGNTLGSYPYATVNAFNLYMLLGANWMSVGDTFLLFTFDTWGNIFLALIIGFAVFLCVHDYVKRKDPAFYFYLALFLVAAVFVLGTKMHERYFFPTVPLALFCYIAFKDKRFLFIFAGFSVTLLLNQEMVLNLILTRNSTFIARDNLLGGVLSVINMLLLLYVIKVGIDLLLRKRRCEAGRPRIRVGGYPEPDTELKPLPEPLKPKRLYTRNDYILIICLTLVYACVALYQLGSFRAPQTAWRPQSPKESVTADLGDQKQIHRLYYFLGLGTGSYRIEFSEDSTSWDTVRKIDRNNPFGFMEWKYMSIDTRARYVKITVEQPGLMLNELGLYEKNSTIPIPVQNIMPVPAESEADQGLLQSKAAHLFDEQDTIAYLPGCFSGFYFDEVYFARTGYEHSRGLPPSETTHPPLGKIIIGLGITLFGMVPFGWRFMGVLLGIFMVPLMYAFGKKIFKKTEAAFIVAFLFAFDFMHFVQTRIATIDVYAVFFVILMYYFMYTYYRLNFFEHKLKKTLVPLLLCGICFGLGAACKWTALYGGLGLAVIFFITVGRRVREFMRARRVIKKGRRVRDYARGVSVLMFGNMVITQPQELVYRKMVKKFPQKLAVTLLWCVLVFIIIPVFIYFSAYLPVIAASNPADPLAFVINDQAYMYNYHSQLTASHPFSSSWWEWPFMIRPMWYYSGHELLPRHSVSSIAAFGNPAVWWVGVICFCAALFIAISKKDGRMLFIFIAFLSQYLPWVIIPRDLTFIYHFFTAVPFLVIFIAYVINVLITKYPRVKYAVYAYLFIVLFMFALFYPILSGITVAKSYVAAVLRWFESWVFFI
jgi:dolichyl-phosphate-mannose-protein mannosyltransferase